MVHGFFDDDLAPALLWCGTWRENKNPLPPPPLLPHVDSLPDVLSAMPADQWPGLEGKSCSVIGWMSTWGALDRTTPKNLYTLEGTLKARLSPAG